ncbi:hypothetical protein [Rubrobacter aplysinae]|uniref:hypothetical protein n=1 Tax=Rubrobacter aplysinae TaxID=909625 RepID=UPI00128B093E|nr:hypothetical protein [Rubrobacter aplysinae]
MAALFAMAVVCAGLVVFSAGVAEAQEGSVEATGELIKPQATSYMYGTHAIEDEATGTMYALQSEAVDLDRYVGERVTVNGTVVPGYEAGAIEGGPALIQVSDLEAADQGSSGDQYADEDQGASGDQYSDDQAGQPGSGGGSGLPERLPDTGGLGIGAALLAAAGLLTGAFLLRRR